jgi:hypothetical protein
MMIMIKWECDPFNQSNGMEIYRLTPLGYWHDVSFEKERKDRFVSIFSNVNQPFRIQIFQIIFDREGFFIDFLNCLLGYNII